MTTYNEKSIGSVEHVPLGASAEATADKLTEHVAWLREFERQNGRSLRVLHVGNIANNAYLNAKFLRTVGVEADVLCCDYSHVMGTPEWEDVEIRDGHGDDFSPRFSKRDLADYQRPNWFFGGPLLVCVDEVQAHWEDGRTRTRSIKDAFVKHLLSLSESLFGARGQYAFQLALADPLSAAIRVHRRLFASLEKITKRTFKRLFPGTSLFLGTMRTHHLQKWAKPKNLPLGQQLKNLPLGQQLKNLPLGQQLILIVLRVPRAVASRMLRMLSSIPSRVLWWTQSRAEKQEAARLIAEYDAVFTRRQDRLTMADVLPYRSCCKSFRKIFRHYDVVQCYATHPMHAVLVSQHPYVAFEHGTLRDFTMGDNALHRMTALGYRRADHTFITNGDCLEYAHKLGIDNLSPMIHPIDVEQHRADYGNAIAALREEICADIVLFCPLRHDWAVKGTDVHLRALPLIKERVSGHATVKLVLIRWGAQIAESEALIRELGCSNDVVWRPSMCRISTIKHIRAANVVLDQTALPHFGATAPQSIAAGTPVISSYEPESTRWIIPEPAPIIPAFEPEHVAKGVMQALDPDWLSEYRRRAQDWTDRYHHPNNVIDGHLNVYRRVLENGRQSN